MNPPFVVNDLNPALCAVAFGLLAYLLHRVKQRRLARMHRDRSAEIQPGGDAFDDDFYCIMVKGGGTRAGFIDRYGRTPE